jgi:hypothetical protein
MCFVRISEQTAIISLYNINWLVFITEKECVYCAVRTERLYIKQIRFAFKGLSKNTTFKSVSYYELYTIVLDGILELFRNPKDDRPMLAFKTR